MNYSIWFYPEHLGDQHFYAPAAPGSEILNATVNSLAVDM